MSAPVPTDPRGSAPAAHDATPDAPHARTHDTARDASGTAAEALERERAELRQRLAKAMRKLGGRAAAVERDLGKIDEAAAWAARASWLVPAAARAPRGARELVVSDWSSGVEEQLRFPLDPALPAREQVEKTFDEAKRLRRGRPVAEKRLQLTRDALSTLGALDARAEAAIDEDELEAIEREARAVAPREMGPPKPGREGKRARRGEEQPRPPYRTFVGAGGVTIWVGRGAEHNDRLTLDVARPHHLWLHAKDRTGAHVVVRLDKGKQATAEQLVDAAHLAAHFSDARGEPIVDVSYTPRRYVRKRRGLPVGAVVLDRERVLPLRVEPERLAQLLAAEVPW